MIPEEMKIKKLAESDIQKMSDQIQKKYNSLVIGGKLFPVSPQELAAIITRINDGTISSASGKIVFDELAKRNMAFIKSVHELAGLPS